MIQDSYFDYQDECHYLAHSDLSANRPTLLIIHGLGDSGLSYREFLRTRELDDFNIIIPDLLGHGKSARAREYTFEKQTQGIIQHINHLQEKFNLELNDFVLLSHSMGSIHATYLCESELKNKIKRFINVEGSVTQYGSFISQKVAAEVKDNHFDAWFTNFKMNNIYHDMGWEYLAFRRYFASLMFCNPDAFLQNALQMYRLCTALPGNKYTNLIGKKYAELNVPRVYCYGDSMDKENLAFLQENKLATQYIHFPTHFFMPDGFQEIVELLKSPY